MIKNKIMNKGKYNYINKKLKLPFLLLYIFIMPYLIIAQTGGNTDTDKFGSITDEVYTKGVFSGNVLIVKDGNIIFEKSTGDADYGINMPNTPDTKFQIGSITKFFTKTIIHQLAQENKLSMTDNIGKYLSGFSPDVSENVTIQELADHTSGLGDYIESLNPQTAGNIKSIGDILPFIQQEKLLFPPGSKTHYSNSGYVVLANIIEKIEGKKYGDILEKRILDKAGMDNTGFNVINMEVPGKAKGYLSNQIVSIGPKQDNSDMNIIGGGDGGIYSTAGDLYKFAHSLISDNKLLSDESKVQLFNSPLFPVQYTSWDDFKTRGRLGIAGGAPGISAFLGINMEKNYIMIVLSNYDMGTAEGVSKRLSALLNGREAEPFSPPPSKIIYDMIKEKGAQNFMTNYKTELASAGIKLDDDMILLFAGQQFLMEKDADNALALYSVYTSEFPNIVIAWNDMGDAYLLKGEKNKAKDCYEQALKIRPGNKRAKESLEKLN